MNTEGLSETPLHFISRYKGDSVGRYRRYPRYTRKYRGYREGEFLLATANEILRDAIIICHQCELFYHHWNYSNELSTNGS
jgi:hypothetical protein